MPSKATPLILHQRVVKRGSASLHCREISLRLSNDQHHLVLTRYTEHYSPEGLQWVERSHTVPMSDLLQWMIANGEPQSLEQNEDEPLARRA